MTVNSSAEMHIQWIEFVYNTTDSIAPTQPQGGKSTCANICSIDQTSKLGAPVLVQEPGTKGVFCFFLLFILSLFLPLSTYLSILLCRC